MAKKFTTEDAAVETLRYGANTGRQWQTGLDIIEIAGEELDISLNVATLYPALSRLQMSGIVRDGIFVFPNGRLYSREERKLQRKLPGVVIGPVNDEFLEPYRHSPKVRVPEEIMKQNPHSIERRYTLSRYGEMMPVADIQVVETGIVMPGLAMGSNVNSSDKVA